MITDVVFTRGIVTDVVSILLPVEKTRGLLDLDVATDHRQSLSGFVFSLSPIPPFWKNALILLLKAFVPSC